MQKIVDAFTSATGWTVNAPSTVSANTFSQYCAGLQTTSLLFKFAAADGTKTATKTMTAVDVTGYEEIVFHACSLQRKTNILQKISDFKYKLTLNTTHVFYIPVKNIFDDIVVKIPAGVTSITAIKFESLNSEDDYLYVSYMVAVKDEFPLDIFKGLKTHLEAEIQAKYTNGIQIGSITATAGATSITISALLYSLHRYAVIKIVGGGNSEIHDIQVHQDSGVCTLGQLYAGPALLFSYTGAAVYLQFPVEYGRMQQDIALPGITVWGFNTDIVLRDLELEREYDTWQSTGVQERQQGRRYVWMILIDCESREYELLAKMAQVVRAVIAKKELFINGRRCRIDYDGGETELYPDDATLEIPKIQFETKIELVEEVYDRVARVYETTTTVNAELEE